jgi:hypothetical protein
MTAPSLLTERDLYETLLAEYSNHEMAMLLLQQHRPYMEMVPSIRRSRESIITLPLPTIKIRGSGSLVLPCDLAYLLCDPEWKIKIGGEIIVLIQRPDEHFSELLGRWRQTQVILDCDYEWHRPNYYRQMMTEGGDRLYPLFVLYPNSDQRFAKGLRGAHLPFVISNLLINLPAENELPETASETAEELTE